MKKVILAVAMIVGSAQVLAAPISMFGIQREVLPRSGPAHIKPVINQQCPMLSGEYEGTCNDTGETRKLLVEQYSCLRLSFNGSAIHPDNIENLSVFGSSYPSSTITSSAWDMENQALNLRFLLAFQPGPGTLANFVEASGQAKVVEGGIETTMKFADQTLVCKYTRK